MREQWLEDPENRLLLVMLIYARCEPYLVRIEVGVEDDHCVCAVKVDANTTSACCEEIYKDI